MNTFKKVIGWFAIVAVFGLGFAMVAFPASVTQIAGLAVAQSSTQWNQLKDMAQGDSQTSGVALFSPCLWNGSSCDRQRGTATGGANVTVSNTSAAPAATTTGQGATLLNSTQTSGANAAQTITLTGSASQRVTIDFVEAFLSAAGACTLTIVDNATTVYSHPLTTQTATTQLQVPLGNDGLTISTGNNSTVNVGACGVGITSTLNVIASRQ